MNTSDISSTIEHALAAAGLDSRRGPAALATIRAALEAAGVPRPRASQARAEVTNDIIDLHPVDPTLDGQKAATTVGAPRGASGRQGRFLAARCESRFGHRRYKLYVPSSYRAEQPMPLVVMLHGCRQDPDDFAAGTGLNRLAEEHGLLVAYPEQPKAANGSRCWNWFEPQHQRREGAEPSMIVGIVREIAREYRVDEDRVFVAGLSAGAAMAMILAEAYPEVFAAVAAHSGMPAGAAHDVASAFAAMHGAPRSTPPFQAAPMRSGAESTAVPTIVFHGDRDVTVMPENGAAIAERSVRKLQAQRGALACREHSRVINGRRCDCVAYIDATGVCVAEHWTVHGAGHAWFGGASEGSFTDPLGPDASREAVRFFLSQGRIDRGSETRTRGI